MFFSRETNFSRLATCFGVRANFFIKKKTAHKVKCAVFFSFAISPARGAQRKKSIKEKKHFATLRKLRPPKKTGGSVPSLRSVFFLTLVIFCAVRPFESTHTRGLTIIAHGARINEKKKKKKIKNGLIFFFFFFFALPAPTPQKLRTFLFLPAGAGASLRSCAPPPVFVCVCCCCFLFGGVCCVVVVVLVFVWLFGFVVFGWFFGLWFVCCWCVLGFLVCWLFVVGCLLVGC